jgi:hypothetical protein
MYEFLFKKMIDMKKMLPLLLPVTIFLILSGCKKNTDATSSIPDIALPTTVGTPIGDSTMKTIGQSGGSLASADGNAELIFPAGALSNNTNISIQAITNNAPNGIANAYRFLPEGITFLQPVTLKFHYKAEDLAATLGDLMGIAFQDSTGIWYRVNNFTNDTVNKIISAPIRHFTDWTPFDILYINPEYGNIKVNLIWNLEVYAVSTDDGALKFDPNNDEVAPLIRLRNNKVVWSANGIVNGNPTVGTLTGGSLIGSFKAPAKVPTQNPVTITALVGATIKYHGKTFDKMTLISSVNIVDKQKFDLLIVVVEQDAVPFVYKDSATMTVTVDANDSVTISDISNSAPYCLPLSVTTTDGCTSTWVQDGIGEINITSGTGQAVRDSGDPSWSLLLRFTHTGAVSPKFHRVCTGGDDEILGGIPIAGVPDFLYFNLLPETTHSHTDDGQSYAFLDLQ